METKFIAEIVGSIGALGVIGIIIRVYLQMYRQMQECAKQSDLEHFATKADVNHLEEKHYIEIKNINKKLDSLDNKMDKMSESFRNSKK